MSEWDAHWDDYADSARANPAQAYRRALIYAQLEKAGSPQDLCVLDIGCGSGDLLAGLKNRFPAVKLGGIDQSASGLEQTAEKVPQARLAKVNLLSHEEPAPDISGWADCAICSEVLEHVDDPVRLLSAAAAYLKPGATLIITVPGGPRSAFDRHIGHRRHFTKKELRQVIEKAGFEPLQVSAAGFPFFNLYRLLVFIRGKKLINDAAGPPGFLARSLGALFNILFRFNLADAPLGWQMTAVARKKP